MNSKLPTLPTYKLEPIAGDQPQISTDELLERGHCLFIVLRTPNCPLCKKTVKEYNVNVYVILKDKIDAHHLDYCKENIFIDSQYNFYKFLGDENGQVRMIPPLKLLTPGPIKEYIKAYYEGFRNTEHLSDNMVLGGTILVSNQKEVLYQFSEPLPGYQPDLNRIVNDCRALKGQATAEQDFNVAFSSDNLLSLGIDFSRIG
ncbi:hypothetical protein HDV06_002851 [Boothiomyces sp. JEL0866]|nr:hypothetical protein HDV06_002851 [Boothiomyces sp. JEL0866]